MSTIITNAGKALIAEAVKEYYEKVESGEIAIPEPVKRPLTDQEIKALARMFYSAKRIAFGQLEDIDTNA